MGSCYSTTTTIIRKASDHISELSNKMNNPEVVEVVAGAIKVEGNKRYDPVATEDENDGKTFIDEEKEIDDIFEKI